MSRITPFLWFEDQAEEAARFYTSLFDDSRIMEVSRYTEAGAAASGRPPGSVMTVAFRLAGQDFVALNGGPHFRFSEAISLLVSCETQAEVDELWEKLSAGGEKGRCGWLKDRYGLSWQVVPTGLTELLDAESGERSERATSTVLEMDKIELERVKQAYEGPPA